VSNNQNVMGLFSLLGLEKENEEEKSTIKFINNQGITK
jgi:hypothetical protein